MCVCVGARACVYVSVFIFYCCWPWFWNGFIQPRLISELSCVVMTRILQSLPLHTGIQMLTSDNKKPFVFGDKVYVSPSWLWQSFQSPECWDYKLGSLCIPCLHPWCWELCEFFVKLIYVYQAGFILKHPACVSQVCHVPNI